MAMTTAQQQDRRSLYDSTDEDLDMNIPVQVLNDRHPYFPPPPTAAKKTKRPIVRSINRPVEEMPPLPPLPAFITRQSPQIPPTPLSSNFGAPPASPISVTGKTKRKTLLQRIEGWWDLGLLERRQTLFGVSKSG
ncbi:hypothetical protein ACHAQJ_004651 [Trichoderma viride]